MPEQDMRIAFLDPYADIWGGERILLDICFNLVKNGSSCMVAAPGAGSLEKSIREKEITFFPIAMGPFSTGKKNISDILRMSRQVFSRIYPLSRAIKEFNAQCIYSNGSRTDLMAVFLGIVLKLPVVFHLHIMHNRGFYARLDRFLAGRRTVRLCIANSRATGEAFIDSSLLRNKTDIIHNWPSPKYLAEPGSRDSMRQFLSEKHSIPPNAFWIGTVGRISPNKGQMMAVDAVKKISENHENSVLLLAGDPGFETKARSYYDAIRLRVSEAGLKNRLFMLGKIENLGPSFYDALDLLIQPSRWEEPFGLTAVEAMSRGIPVLAAKCGGLGEIVRDKVNGRTFISKNQQDLERVLGAMLDNPSETRHLAEEGQRHILENFNPDIQLEKIRKLLNSIIF